MRPEGVGVLRIDLTTKIDAKLADTVARAVVEYPNHSIEIFADCEGGCWASAVTIFGSLKWHKRRVSAFITRAASAGALIVMAADYRQLSADGHFWLHWPVGAHPKATLDGVAATKATLMASGCRVPADQILRWMAGPTTIDAKRALAVGLVHEVPGLPQPKHPVVFL